MLIAVIQVHPSRGPGHVLFLVHQGPVIGGPPQRSILVSIHSLAIPPLSLALLEALLYCVSGWQGPKCGLIPRRPQGRRAATTLAAEPPFWFIFIYLQPRAESSMQLQLILTCDAVAFSTTTNKSSQSSSRCSMERADMYPLFSVRSKPLSHIPQCYSMQANPPLPH